MAAFEHRLACVINADGSIARGYLIDKCEMTSEGVYVVSWGIPLQNSAKTNFSCVISSAAYESVEPGFCTVGLLENPVQMRVCTYDAPGKPSRRSFHLACFRDQ